MTNRMTTAIVTLGLVVGTGESLAGERFRTGTTGVESNGAEAVTALTADVLSAIDPALYEYYRVSSNIGLVEYAFAPPAEMSPVGTNPPRPGPNVARKFLELNADALGILQDPADFARVLDERVCDGSERVVFEQTYGGIKVDSSFFEVMLQGQQVKRVAARFVSDTSTLPICLMVPPPGSELSFLPQTGGNIVIATSIEGVVGPGHAWQRVYRDACTGQVIGRTLIVK